MATKAPAAQKRQPSGKQRLQVTTLESESWVHTPALLLTSHDLWQVTLALHPGFQRLKQYLSSLLGKKT